jgi:hypothetical protein
MKVNGTGIVGLLGLALLAAGTWLAWGPAAALIVVGAVLLVIATVGVLVDRRGQET